MQCDFILSAIKSRENKPLSAGIFVFDMNAGDLAVTSEEPGGAYQGMWFLKRQERIKASTRRSHMLQASFKIESLSLRECVRVCVSKSAIYLPFAL
jgi:hypothetical protein